MELNNIGCLSLGMKAPDFTATTTFGPIMFSEFGKGKWVVLLSHPRDFTPVCTTEFMAFAQANQEFVKRNAQLLGLSIDSNPSHLAWVYNIFQNTGIQIPFPVIADRMAEVARMYGMIAPDASKQETVRSVFIIDPNQVIRAILTYPLTNGRNISEILRLVDALQTTDAYKVATPVNWMPGQPAVIPAPTTYEELLQRKNNSQQMGLNCKDWYLCYKDIK